MPDAGADRLEPQRTRDGAIGRHSHQIPDPVVQSVRRTAIRVVAIALAGSGVLLLATPFLSTFLHLSSPAPLAALALLVALSSGLAVFRAAIWGLGRFISLGLNQVVEAFLRLLAGVILVGSGPGPTGALGAYAFGQAAALALATRGFLRPSPCAGAAPIDNEPPGRQERQGRTPGTSVGRLVNPFADRSRGRNTADSGDLAITRNHKSSDQNPRSWRTWRLGGSTSPGGIGWAALLVNAAFLVMLSADVIAVKHFFPPETAGQYAALSTLGKALFMVTNAFDTALFPAAAAAHAAGSSAGRQLHLALAGIAATVAPSLAIYWLLAEPLVHLLFGERYAAAAPLLGPYGLAIAALALAATLAKYALAFGRATLCGPLLVLAAAELAALAAFHESLEQVVAVLLTVGAVALAGSILVELRAGPALTLPARGR
ncbi:MAG: oligosaccharide flippase family protein [Chloroflexi bacterium]|nr:oligosaccharide flippase family protein [Chloroflexota bacterium]